MWLELLDLATADLIEGFHFYERQEASIGTYFLDTLYSDIDSLRICGGIHRKAYKNLHRVLSKRFPFASYYTVELETVRCQTFGSASDIILRRACKTPLKSPGCGREHSGNQNRDPGTTRCGEETSGRLSRLVEAQGACGVPDSHGPQDRRQESRKLGHARRSRSTTRILSHGLSVAHLNRSR